MIDRRSFTIGATSLVMTGSVFTGAQTMAAPGGWLFGLGQGDDDLPRFEPWLGKRVSCLAGWTANAKQVPSWDWLAGGAGTSFDSFSGVMADAGAWNFWQGVKKRPTIRHVLMLPLVPGAIVSNQDNRNPRMWTRLKTGGDLNEIWRNTWHRFGRRMAARTALLGAPCRNVVLNLGWEFTGSWYPWYAGPDFTSYLDAFKIAVDEIRRGTAAQNQGGGHFLIEQRTAEGIGSAMRAAGATLPKILATRDHIDILGCGLHEDQSWNTEAGWLKEIWGGGPFAPSERHAGIANISAYARKIGVPFACDEWAIVRRRSGDWKPAANPALSVRRVFDFFKSLGPHLAHECYMVSGHTNMHDNPAWLGSRAYRMFWGGPEGPVGSAA